MEPKQNSPIIVVTILAIIVSAAVTGGIVYTIQNKQNTTTKNDLQAQVDSLKSQIAALPTATPTPIVSASPTASPVSIASPAASATPSTTGTFTDAAAKISYSYPKDWTVNNATNSQAQTIQNIYNSAVPYVAGSTSNIPVIEVKYEKDTYSSSISTYITKQGFSTPLTSEATTIGGKSGYKYVGTYQNSAYNFVVIFTNGYVYNFSNLVSEHTLSATDTKSVNDAYSQILTTTSF